MNSLTIKPLKDGDTIKYLGIDKNISCVGTLNKEKVMKECLTRVKKIWQLELSSFNKVINHNTFAIHITMTTRMGHSQNNQLDNPESNYCDRKLPPKQRYR